jgi:hypothetical protein
MNNPDNLPGWQPHLRCRECNALGAAPLLKLGAFCSTECAGQRLALTTHEDWKPDVPCAYCGKPGALCAPQEPTIGFCCLACAEASLVKRTAITLEANDRKAEHERHMRRHEESLLAGMIVPASTPDDQRREATEDAAVNLMTAAQDIAWAMRMKCGVPFDNLGAIGNKIRVLLRKRSPAVITKLYEDVLADYIELCVLSMGHLINDHSQDIADGLRNRLRCRAGLLPSEPDGADMLAATLAKRKGGAA